MSKYVEILRRHTILYIIVNNYSDSVDSHKDPYFWNIININDVTHKLL